MSYKLERAAMQQAIEFIVDCEYGKAELALREALAEPELNLNCKSVQKRLATSWGYVKAEQAEQEPVGEMIDKAGYKGAAWYLEPPATGTKLYAAPVRTKDLTDDEIHKLVKHVRFDGMTDRTFQFARAVIAADREKNK